MAHDERCTLQLRVFVLKPLPQPRFLTARSCTAYLVQPISRQREQLSRFSKPHHPDLPFEPYTPQQRAFGIPDNDTHPQHPYPDIPARVNFDAIRTAARDVRHGEDSTVAETFSTAVEGVDSSRALRVDAPVVGLRACVADVESFLVGGDGEAVRLGEIVCGDADVVGRWVEGVDLVGEDWGQTAALSVPWDLEVSLRLC